MPVCILKFWGSCGQVVGNSGLNGCRCGVVWNAVELSRHSAKCRDLRTRSSDCACLCMSSEKRDESRIKPDWIGEVESGKSVMVEGVS